MKAPTLLALLLLLPLPARAGAALDCDDLSSEPLNHGVVWADVWRALDLQASCTQNCHIGSQPSAMLDFSNAKLSIYYLVEQTSVQSDRVLRVAPTDPEASLLMQKIGCRDPAVGRPMPPPQGHLPLSLQALIYDWIAEGALGEGAEDPIQRDRMFHDSMETGRRFPPYVPSQENGNDDTNPVDGCENGARPDRSQQPGLPIPRCR